MSRQHQDSLRQQLIDAMKDYGIGASPCSPELVFEKALWPVLDKAIEAGELLVHRNTGPVQKPVHEAITAWLEVVGWTVQKVKAEEHTVSKAILLKLLYDLDTQCQVALSEAKMVSPKI